MKLIFVKNLRNSKICKTIFNHLLNSNYKKNTKSFIKSFRNTCNDFNVDNGYIINNITSVIENF